ncbi:NAD-dependent deacylase [Sulfitobacter sabulilitoris]|uniref:NAD-dependent protein deacylase n=1 Tax=Sulfitobacter sabulilitoris TaxID=2562655 RepID=A0A5S3PD29_9RHOB|nr:NAD-dependent deacylase [Sulfitobacter sabulilitoris]TMM51668.1 NAD-dependent deacylase [Sulfitobacter sabulilitoris]
MSKIVILTGAGISAESGLGTFRAENGLWAQHRVEDVATPEGFARDPKLVVDFYNARRAQAADAAPNEGHMALARLEAEYDGEVVLVTQNVDDLHEKAGMRRVIHMHGALSGALCGACDHRWDAPRVMAPGDACPACGRGTARPDIVWFGEMPYHMDEIFDHLAEADVFAAVGTSGNVYPAAGFVAEARRFGARTIEFNLERSAVGNLFEDYREGSASWTLPRWVDEMLGHAAPRPKLPF